LPKLRNISCEELIVAMKVFDRDHLPRTNWINWEKNRAHHQAIQHKGHLYPVKKVVSIAMGIPVKTFHARDAKRAIERGCSKVTITTHPSQ
jgi:hypothetical protein